jgi:hypothetical protein
MIQMKSKQQRARTAAHKLINKNAIGPDDRQAYGHQNPVDAEFELCSLSL